MFTVLISIIIVLAVLLVLVILSQNSKGGVGSAFGGGASQIMGVTKTGNILEKSTWILALAILVLSLGSSAFYTSSSVDSFSSPNIESAKQQVVMPQFDNSGEGESLLPSTPSEETTTEEGNPTEEETTEEN
ncbi:protein translocase subunit secG [Belliella baltica DSM 15883]|uniref:Protein-export membrane protein SecG n=1 Tax=Belliella baltica (strain DSM 15883 / CIP 108006 / LMG 21964 / BA134) TaxID=866536 RepID=I3Z9L2_BELBD|nr:preprotein translocase subunit SecG [Belliella baltica]AFL85930.1 protein translocase subunit secG [Belliella baltica DSM 15883]